MHYITQLATFSAENLLKKHHNYLLLEGDLNPNLYEEVTGIAPVVEKRWVYKNTEFDNEKEQGPLLVRLDVEHKLLQHFVDHWTEQHLGVIISTQVSLNELMRHLLNLRYVVIPKGNPLKKILFRWYEPRQLQGVLYGFSQIETAYFMNSISSISWCEWAYDQGIWYQAIKPDITEEQPFSAPLEITQATLNSISQHDEKYYARELTRGIIAEYPAILKTENEQQLHTSIITQIRLAIAHGIERRKEIKALIFNSINWEAEKI